MINLLKSMYFYEMSQLQSIIVLPIYEVLESIKHNIRF